jgi:tripartite-type tricarboxylate transporter receptor subunit TctC
MGQPVVVINRPGATGLAGTQTLARSSPDGYTLGYISMATLVAQMMMTRPPVDLPRETTVISAPFQQYTVLLTQPSESIRDARALIARLKTRGGSINFSSGGNGTPAHLAGELFRRAAGLDAQHIPYKQLTGALVDVMNGQVQFIFSIGGSAVPLVKSGKLTALAVAAPKRLDVLPEVPTLAESTGIELDFSSWNALIAPVGTPETVLRQLNKLVGEIVQDSEHRKAFIALGLDLMDSPYDQAANLLRSEGARWARFVRDTGISAD